MTRSKERLRRIAIVGGGGFGREVAMLIEQINAADPTWDIAGFIDDSLAPGTDLNGYPVLGGVDACSAWTEPTAVCLALGWPQTRQRVLDRLTNPVLQFPTLVHPGVTLDTRQRVSVGEGSIICAGNIITTNITIGRFVVINLMCTIGHDAVIGDLASLMPMCNISGSVTVGRRTFWGTGAKVIEGKSVGDGTVVGAGAVVITDLPAGATAVGVPARVVKTAPKAPS